MPRMHLKKGEKKMGMRDYEDIKDIVIPKEQEEMMNIICDAWDECRSLNSCRECPDRPKEYMRMMMCTSLKYTRKFIEAGYTKQSIADVQEVVRCKNCRFFDPYDKVEDFDGRCVVRDCETDKEEFCSYGSKRGDEK